MLDDSALQLEYLAGMTPTRVFSVARIILEYDEILYASCQRHCA